MTIYELERLINEWRSGGADDHTAVLLATQSNYHPLAEGRALVNNITDDVVVVYEDDADRDGLGMPYDEGGVSHVMLCEGPQRYAEPYPTEAETAALAEAGWGR